MAGGKKIKSLKVFSSGWAEQHREHRYGSWMPPTLWALFSRSWVKLPINFFAIDHVDGMVLFDTGLDPAIKSDPDYISSAIGRFLLNRLFRLNISDEHRIDRLLKSGGIEAGNVRKAVISHLHFDHIGGISHIPQAKLLVSKREWAQLSQPSPEREWILREHIELDGSQWCPFEFFPSSDPLFAQFDGIFDVAGDGSMILLPTPGHTPGSVSMLIRQVGWAPILLVADLTYEAAMLEQDRVPGVGDAPKLRKSFAKVRRLKRDLPDMVIVPSHDFSAELTIAAACGGGVEA